MACDSCPFGLTELSEMALNLGCLPDPGEIMAIKKETGKNWSCHADESRICAGFVERCAELGIPYKGAPLASYNRWYHEGKP